MSRTAHHPPNERLGLTDRGILRHNCLGGLLHAVNAIRMEFRRRRVEVQCPLDPARLSDALALGSRNGVKLFAKLLVDDTHGGRFRASDIEAETHQPRHSVDAPGLRVYDADARQAAVGRSDFSRTDHHPRRGIQGVGTVLEGGRPRVAIPPRDCDPVPSVPLHGRHHADTLASGHEVRALLDVQLKVRGNGVRFVGAGRGPEVADFLEGALHRLRGGDS